ncbi:MAG: signal peptidase I [Candidatus Eisenbacteria bacterium]|uniref:Signal peptidase I n=1 Tax=Eiseniibacteriota bacterium TaxID=2212470 RepID=A0A956NH89_UNCEI|nr:signal peptidase I [Candidatus Eisenbacteria bacterium]
MEIIGAILNAGFLFFYLAVLAVTFLIAWKVYEKAGKPGWAALIPIYNLIVLLEIVDRPLWWVILFFVPVANIVIAFLVYLELAKCFGQDLPFAIGLFLLPVVFMAILAFGDYRYIGNRM